MKQMLEYFMIDGEVGGNQDWFRNVVMHIGGCAAATACDCCIYFAKYKEKKNLYPFDVNLLNKEDYIRFSMKMKPYLRPRMSGVNKLWMYTEGFGKYLKDAEESVKFEEFSGNRTAREAAAFIKKKINEGIPVPYLMLRHKDKKFADFVWHWFLCIGYEETADDLLITVATYGEATTFSLKELWNTGYEEKGGLIGIEFMIKLNEESTGIRKNVLEEIINIAKKYDINKVVLFGSRARGDYKRTSDIDLAVEGGDIAGFALDIEEETTTLLQYDIVDLGRAIQDELRKSIEREGKVLYEKV